MSLVSSINYFLTLFLDTFRQFGRWRIWLLLVGYFAFHWLLLFSHYRFYSPLFYGVVQTWLHLIDADNAVGFTHYPGHFMLLPHLFELTRFYASILIESAVLGAVAVMFYRSYLPDESRADGPYSAHWLFQWVQVVLAWLVIQGLFLLINNSLPEWLHSELVGAPRRMFVFTYMLQPSLRILILAVFFFAIPYVAIHRVNFLRGLYRSVGIFRRSPFTCLFLAAIISAGPVSVHAVLQDQALIIAKFQPELIYWILLAGLVLNIFVYFFWMGTASRRLLDDR